MGAGGVGIGEQDNEPRPGLAPALPRTIFVTLGKLLSVDDYFFICKTEAFILTSRALLNILAEGGHQCLIAKLHNLFSLLSNQTF